MSTTGPNSPSTVYDVGDNFNNWSNPGQASGADSVVADVVLPALNTSSILRGKGFGFSIPSTDTIDGLALEIEGFTDVNTVNVGNIALAIDTGSGTLDEFAFGPAINTTDALQITFMGILVFGGPTDLWGATLTPAILNDPDLSVDFSLSKSKFTDANPGIDDMRLIVYHSPPGESPTVISVSLTSVVYTGQPISIVRNIVKSVVAASLTYTPKAITVSAATVKAVVAASLTYVPKPIAAGVIITIASSFAVLTYVGYATSAVVTVGQVAVRSLWLALGLAVGI